MQQEAKVKKEGIHCNCHSMRKLATPHHLLYVRHSAIFAQSGRIREQNSQDATVVHWRNASDVGFGSDESFIVVIFWL
jgi:hypothetical protein